MSGSFALFLAALALSSCWCCWHLGRDRGRWEILHRLDPETREEVLERELGERDE